MPVLLPAELAWYVTGRFYCAPDGSLADFGYFLHLAGIGADLFNGAPGASTAHFTFAARPFRADRIGNGGLSLALDTVGEFSIYLQLAPAGDFDDPGSFARGECIATFRRTSMVVGTTVDGAATTQPPSPLISSNVFSARLVQSALFEFAGRRHNLGQIIGHGVTQFGTASTTPIATPTKPRDIVLPFSGSAIALG